MVLAALTAAGRQDMTLCIQHRDLGLSRRRFHSEKSLDSTCHKPVDNQSTSFFHWAERSFQKAKPIKSIRVTNPIC